MRFGLDRAGLVDRLADDVDDAAERAVADRHRDRRAGVGDFLAAHQTFGGVHRDGAHRGSRRDAARLRAPGGCRRSLVSSAFRIAGRWPSNCTSTTAPMTWVMRPIWLAGVAMNSLLRILSRHRQLTCCQSASAPEMISISSLVIMRLTGAVVDHRLLADHVAGVAGGVVHRAHLRAVHEAVFSSSARKICTAMLRGSSSVEDLVLVRLVFVGRRRAGIRGRRFHHRRDDLLRGRDLRDHRLEARVEQRADVELAGLEQRDDLLGDRPRR